MSNSNKAILNSLLNTFAAAREKRSDVRGVWTEPDANQTLMYRDPVTDEERKLRINPGRSTFNFWPSEEGLPGVRSTFANALGPMGYLSGTGNADPSALLMQDLDPSAGQSFVQGLANPLAAAWTAQQGARLFPAAMYGANLLNAKVNNLDLSASVLDNFKNKPTETAAIVGAKPGASVYTSPKAVPTPYGWLSRTLRSFPVVSPFIQGRGLTNPFSPIPVGDPIPAAFESKNTKSPPSPPPPPHLTPAVQALNLAMATPSATAAGIRGIDMAQPNAAADMHSRGGPSVVPPRSIGISPARSITNPLRLPYLMDPRAPLRQALAAKSRRPWLELLATGAAAGGQTIWDYFANPQVMKPTPPNPDTPEGHAAVENIAAQDQAAAAARRQAELKQQLLDRANT